MRTSLRLCTYEFEHLDLVWFLDCHLVDGQLDCDVQRRSGRRFYSHLHFSSAISYAGHARSSAIDGCQVNDIRSTLRMRNSWRGSQPSPALFLALLFYFINYCGLHLAMSYFGACLSVRYLASTVLGVGPDLGGCNSFTNLLGLAG